MAEPRLTTLSKILTQLAVGENVPYRKAMFADIASVFSDLAELYPFFGTDSPEGLVVANVGQMYFQIDTTTAAGYRVWYKVSGSGNTGWSRNQLGAVKGARSIEIIGHRGFGNIAPENTLASASLAAGMAHSLEGDVQITSDGYPIMMHDGTVDRTTDGTGNVTAFTLAGIQALDAGSWFDTRWANTRVPRFEDWLAIAATSFERCYPEIKGYRSGQISTDIAAMVQAIVDAQMEDRTGIQSFNWLTDFPIVRLLSSRIELVYLANDITQFNQALPYAKADGNASIAISYLVITANPSIVVQARAAGIDLIAWTVDSTEIARQLTDLGVTRLMSNFLAQTQVAR